MDGWLELVNLTEPGGLVLESDLTEAAVTGFRVELTFTSAETVTPVNEKITLLKYNYTMGRSLLPGVWSIMEDGVVELSLTGLPVASRS